MDRDGTQIGYDIPLTKAVAEAVNIPVIASGGAGTPEHLYQAVTTAKADAALIASIVHDGNYTVQQLKDYMSERGVIVRRNYGNSR
jgi:cyclase